MQNVFNVEVINFFCYDDLFNGVVTGHTDTKFRFDLKLYDYLNFLIFTVTLKNVLYTLVKI